MAEHKEESLMEKIKEKLHDSSSDSDNESTAAAIKAKIFRLFGREQPVHKVFGGGKRIVLVFHSFSFFFPCLFAYF